MKIIEHGDMALNKPNEEFECGYCGCIFEASHEEYTIDYKEYKGIIYTCNCPECGNECYNFWSE